MKVLIVLSLLLASAASELSCRASRRCCDGKNGDCVATHGSDGRYGAADEDEYDYGEECYCDHGCLDVGDCCGDFKDYCGGT